MKTKGGKHPETILLGKAKQETICAEMNRDEIKLPLHLIREVSKANQRHMLRYFLHL